MTEFELEKKFEEAMEAGVITPASFYLMKNNMDLCKMLFAYKDDFFDKDSQQMDFIQNLCMYVNEILSPDFKKAHEDYCRIIDDCSILNFYRKWVSFLQINATVCSTFLIQMRILYKICHSIHFQDQWRCSDFIDFIQNQYDLDTADFVYESLKEMKSELDRGIKLSLPISKKSNEQSFEQSFELDLTDIPSRDELIALTESKEFESSINGLLDRILNDIENPSSINITSTFKKSITIPEVQQEVQDGLIAKLHEKNLCVEIKSNNRWELTFDLEGATCTNPYKSEKEAYIYVESKNYSVTAIFIFEVWKSLYWFPFLTHQVLADVQNALSNFSLQQEFILVQKIPTCTNVYNDLFYKLKDKGYVIEDYENYYKILWR